MHRNNTVYKGYLLTARVERVPEQTHFSAMVTVAPAGMIQRFGDPFLVPSFAAGEYASSPRDAVDVAIAHGCDIVDAIQGNLQS